MTCPEHAELVEWAFSLLTKTSEATAREPLASHLAQCEQCEREFRRIMTMLRTLDNVLEEQATEGTCLDDNMLAEYADGTLAPAARDTAERHMAQCQRCLRQMLELRTVLDEVEERDEQSVLKFVIELARDAMRVVMHPLAGFTPVVREPVPVLGSENDSERLDADVLTWHQVTGPYSLRFDLFRTDHNSLHLSMLAQKDGAPAHNAQFTVWKAGRMVHSQTLDFSGQVKLLNLEPTAYGAELTFDSGEILQISFDFRVQR